MKLIVAGVGPGAAELVTRAALEAAEKADLLLAPCSREGGTSVAADILRANNPALSPVPFYFPMIQNERERDASLVQQIEALRPRWEKAQNIVLPVIGDSALYATGAYLHAVWQGLEPELELELIPGVSAHSLAASCAKRFLALGEEILCVIPGTAPRERIQEALKSADAVALYKPSALKTDLRDVVLSAGPWRKIIRVDRAGLPDERLFTGDDALNRADEYLSLLLLWRRAF